MALRKAKANRLKQPHSLIPRSYEFCNQSLAEECWYSGESGQVCVTTTSSGDEPNQDSAGWIVLSQKRLVLVVADGMGGGPSGAEASAAAIRSLLAGVAAAEAAGRNLRAGILDGFEQAQTEVSDMTAGAATTLTVAEIQNGRLRTYHAGDTVALLMSRAGRCKFVTDAHSPVGYAVKSGLLTEREAMSHEERHLVSNMVGFDEMSVEIWPTVAVAAFDTLILGSDGLFDNLYLEELVSRVRKGPLSIGVAAVHGLARSRMVKPGLTTPSKLDDLTVLGYRQRPSGTR